MLKQFEQLFEPIKIGTFEVNGLRDDEACGVTAGG